jgi:hypothetical protein
MLVTGCMAGMMCDAVWIILEAPTSAAQRPFRDQAQVESRLEKQEDRPEAMLELKLELPMLTMELAWDGITALTVARNLAQQLEFTLNPR